MAGIPGLYIFHHGEERGGIGSDYIRSKTPELLDGIDFAIAFDRYGTTSIITHQGGTRCCSDEFSKSLSKALGGGYKEDRGGSFTDTAHYTGLVGECTNLAVGYMHQHSKGETQDVRYLLDLRKKLLAFDETKLVLKRKAGEVEARSYGGGDWDGEWPSHAPVQRSLPFGGHTRRGYHDLPRLIRNNAEAIAEWFEMEGYDEATLRDEVFQMQGFIKGD
jgi:hypothetical protein